MSRSQPLLFSFSYYIIQSSEENVKRGLTKSPAPVYKLESKYRIGGTYSTELRSPLLSLGRDWPKRNGIEKGKGYKLPLFIRHISLPA